MPYMSITCNTSISKEQEELLKTEIGRLVKILGKSEKILMLHFMPNAALYFRGDSAPAAFVNIQLKGSASSVAYSEMTTSLTTLINQTLSIVPARILVEYEEVTNWGSNGKML